MSSCYIGEIRAVGFTFPPVGWATCNGQSLSIAENQVLFALIGTTYGGDGATSFNVPDLRGRVGLGAQNGASGPGLSTYQLGQTGGQENVTVTSLQLPAHSHPYSAQLAASTSGSVSDEPKGHLPGVATATGNTYGTAQSGKSLATNGVSGNSSPAGSSQPHENRQPVQALNFIIALEGYYPPRPQ